MSRCPKTGFHKWVCEKWLLLYTAPSVKTTKGELNEDIAS